MTRRQWHYPAKKFSAIRVWASNRFLRSYSIAAQPSFKAVKFPTGDQSSSAEARVSTLDLSTRFNPRSRRCVYSPKSIQSMILPECTFSFKTISQHDDIMFA
jgi:hypothetical protein